MADEMYCLYMSIGTELCKPSLCKAVQKLLWPKKMKEVLENVRVKAKQRSHPGETLCLPWNTVSGGSWKDHRTGSALSHEDKSLWANNPGKGSL